MWNKIKAYFGFGWELVRIDELRERDFDGFYEPIWVKRKVRIERNKYTGQRRIV